MAYIGKSPTGTGVRQRYYFTATGGETSISGTDDDGRTLTFSDGEYVDVYLNGILLVADTDYNTTTTNTISSLTALTASDIVEVVVYDIFTVPDAVSKANGGTFGGNVTVNGTLTATTLSGIGTQPNPSLIINGAMQVWQRTTSVTTSSSGTFSADRWASNAGASTTFSRSTDVPTGFQYSISVAGATYTGIRTRIEAADCKHIAGQEVTFSWYAKRTAGTGDMKTYLGYASAEDNFGTVTLIEEVVNTASASVSSNWARYTYTVTLPADAANGLHFVVFNGSASGAVTTLYTGVKLEVGSTATDFVHRSFGDELQRCQRFYQQYLNPPLRGTMSAGSTSSRTGMILPVPMRATPSVTFTQTGASGHAALFNGAASYTISSILASYLADFCIEFDFNLASAPAAATPASLYQDSALQSKFAVSAEL